MPQSVSVLQAAGFVLAAWAVIGNDALQTLGPFLQANRGRTPRALQASFLCLLLCGVLLLGWWRGQGDASWGRLAAYPLPVRFGWPELLPPLAVLLLTQLGAPVSTSFLVLTAFTPATLPGLLRRSLLGYGLALLVAGLVYGAVVLLRRQRAAPGAGSGEKLCCRPPASLLSSSARGTAALDATDPAATAPDAPAPDGAAQDPADASSPALGDPAAAAASAGGMLFAPVAVQTGALVLQWIATGWLWSQWLIQDLANIFIYLPRRLSGGAIGLCLLVLCAGVGLLLLEGGGPIQGILRRKSGLETAGASTAISLLYGAILAALAFGGSQPLSTTWVFLGLLAGRELALGLLPQARPPGTLLRDLGRDLALAALGLAVSLAVAMAVQPLRVAV